MSYTAQRLLDFFLEGVSGFVDLWEDSRYFTFAKANLVAFWVSIITIIVLSVIVGRSSPKYGLLFLGAGAVFSVFTWAHVYRLLQLGYLLHYALVLVVMGLLTWRYHAYGLAAGGVLAFMMTLWFYADTVFWSYLATLSLVFW